MLRVSQTWLGRWSSRDFMRGRSKRAGAVHTRHTHGRKGRFKRLSSVSSSIRDGRRHAENHMQGGLGVKLGGGLFGLRIPRQHQLSHMTKEDFELEVYGHPNITNPYREHLDEHPDLKSVMMNASVATKMVVLMPRVSRNGWDGKAETVVAPVKWRRVAQDVCAALETLTPKSSLHQQNQTSAEPLLRNEHDDSDGGRAYPSVEVHFATLQTSVMCRWPPAASPPLPTASSTAAADLSAAVQACVSQLYRAHCKVGQQLQLVEKQAPAESPSSTHQQHPKGSADSAARKAYEKRRPPAAFMGTALKAPSTTSAAPLASSASSVSFTSSVLAQLTQQSDHLQRFTASLSSVSRTTADEVADGASSSSEGADGVSKLVHRLSATEQPLLRVCVRPSETIMGGAPSTKTAAPRRVLKAEIDANAAVGVWGLPGTSLQELLRWQYCAQDPRAHSHDALPHHRRSLPLLLVVDCSTSSALSRGRSALSRISGAGGGEATAATLMPRRLSTEMEAAGFKMAKETSLQGVAAAISEWSPAAQWDKYTGASVSTSRNAELPPESLRAASC